MRLAILPALAAVLLAAPVHAQADQKEVDRLIGELRPRAATAPITTRGLPKPGAPVAQPSQAQQASASTGVATPRPTAPAAVQTTEAVRPSSNMNVLFATGSADLTPGAVEQLRNLGTALTHASMGQSRFLIEGHTDTVGDKAMNQELSERRAAAVVNFLVQEFRMPAERLTAKGVGEDQLLIPTPDNTPEARNRRVHIVNMGS